VHFRVFRLWSPPPVLRHTDLMRLVAITTDQEVTTIKRCEVPSSDRVRIIFHGGVVLLVGLLCGYPAVAEAIARDESMRLWHSAHENLVMTAILLFAMASVLPSLMLEKREMTGLVWSLIATGYGLMTGLVLQGIAGVRAFGPSQSPLVMAAFVGNAVGILGSMVAAALVVLGAQAALKGMRSGTPLAERSAIQ
jgi:hypothetical protein